MEVASHGPGWVYVILWVPISITVTVTTFTTLNINGKTLYAVALEPQY